MKKIYLLGLLPIFLNVLGAVFSTKVEVFVGGIPAMLLWVIAGVLFTSAILYVIHVVDSRAAHPSMDVEK
ncbi:permease [Paraburkholderia acidicola]|uniref:Permease n=1 Tax=Paraburkholderia acidicola TaxID=1912599 RepID=A0ABV1LVJ5_9BURK